MGETKHRNLVKKKLLIKMIEMAQHTWAQAHKTQRLIIHFDLIDPFQNNIPYEMRLNQRADDNITCKVIK